MSAKKRDSIVCKYEFEMAKCNFPVWNNEDKFCIFHSNLLNEKRKKFKIEFDKYLRKLEKESGKLKVVHGFIFPETLRLHDIKFSHPIWFWNCKFYGDLDIDRCEFNTDFRMNKCTINGSTYIKWSYFNRVFTFNDNIVNENFEFHLNYVKSDTVFRSSKVNGFIAIKYSSFSGELDILDTISEKAWYIYAIDFSKATRTRFRNLDFSNVYFFDSKLVDIDFSGITWRIQKNRIIIGDEISFHSQKIPVFYPVKNFINSNDWESIIESLYLQLCTNFDKNRLFNIAGKFYISALEMRRYSKTSWLKRNIFSWEAWYKYISLYGQSAKRAFWGILLVILTSTFIISFDKNILQTSTPIKINYGLKNILSFLDMYLNAFKYNLYYIIHPAETTFQDKLTITAFVTAWERILIIILGTFFLLALKRRFKRN